MAPRRKPVDKGKRPMVAEEVVSPAPRTLRSGVVIREPTKGARPNVNKGREESEEVLLERHGARAAPLVKQEVEDEQLAREEQTGEPQSGRPHMAAGRSGVATQSGQEGVPTHLVVQMMTVMMGMMQTMQQFMHAQSQQRVITDPSPPPAPVRPVQEEARAQSNMGMDEELRQGEERKRSQRGSESSGQPKRLKPQGGRGGSARDWERRCFACGRMGHSARNCPIGPVCHKCQKPGHKKAECSFGTGGAFPVPAQPQASAQVQAAKAYEAQVEEVVVTGNLLICGKYAHMLFDSSAMHVFTHVIVIVKGYRPPKEP